jgi:hypothetical protein
LQAVGLASFFSRPNATHALAHPKHLPLKKTTDCFTYKRESRKGKRFFEAQVREGKTSSQQSKLMSTCASKK